MSADQMLEQMRNALGWGEPNPVHAWYGSRNGAVFAAGSTPWCQMTVTWAAYFSGNYGAVCPRGDRAYTVWSAEDGDQLSRWYAGTADNLRRFALPGALVYIDWGGTDRIGLVDHVGVIERVLADGRVQTIEGNTADMCKRRVRGADVIAGFWNPPYEKGSAAAKPSPTRNWTEELVETLPLLKKGARGTAVKRMFYLIVSHGFPLDPKVLDPTVMSGPVVKQLKALQRAEGLFVDGECGRDTWAALIKP